MTRLALAIDPAQELGGAAQRRLVRLGRELGYDSAWTPSGADPAAFRRCLAWHRAAGLPTGIAVVPAGERPPGFYAAWAARLFERTEGAFTLGLGSGRMAHPGRELPPYLAELRRLLPDRLPLYLAALGPVMLGLAARSADGVLLNWCSAEQVSRSRALVEAAASASGRPAPPLAGYVRVAVDPSPEAALAALEGAARGYVLGPPVYRRHFERMGFAAALREAEGRGGRLGPELLSAVGAWGAPGTVRAQLLRLGSGLDLALVRVLVSRPGDAGSARLVLEECRPG